MSIQSRSCRSYLCFLCAFALNCLCILHLRAAEPAKPDFADIQSLFDKHCLDCHEAKDPEGDLVLESYETLLKGGESGAAIIPQKSGDSLLFKMIQGTFEKEGKKK